MVYEVRDVVCDYGVFEDNELIVICNKRENAEIIKQVLESDFSKKRAVIIEKNERLQKGVEKLGFSLGVWGGCSNILKDEIGYIKEANGLQELDELNESIESVESAMERSKELINEIYKDIN